MALKLRAMTYNAEEQVRAQKNQATYLVQLSGRTTPKGLHCLSMRLTAEYFALSPEERQLPNQQRVHDADLYHYAVFSDNVLACAVVVNSTVSSAMVNYFCPVIIVFLPVYRVHFRLLVRLLLIITCIAHTEKHNWNKFTGPSPARELASVSGSCVQTEPVLFPTVKKKSVQTCVSYFP